MFLQVENRFL